MRGLQAAVAAMAWCLAGMTTLEAQSTMRPPAALNTQYVMLVIADGVRWQEVFTGADASLMNKASGVSDTASLRRGVSLASQLIAFQVRNRPTQKCARPVQPTSCCTRVACGYSEIVNEWDYICVYIYI